MSGSGKGPFQVRESVRHVGHDGLLSPTDARAFGWKDTGSSGAGASSAWVLLVAPDLLLVAAVTRPGNGTAGLALAW